jgi:hypothetical protein
MMYDAGRFGLLSVAQGLFSGALAPSLQSEMMMMEIDPATFFEFIRIIKDHPSIHNPLTYKPRKYNKLHEQHEQTS